MIKKSYKTRGDTPVFGKPKVYVTGTQRGLDLYLENVENVILDELNCSVWHGDLEAAKESQIIFSIIEKDFFGKGVDESIKSLSAKYFIPIVPIMAESGLQNDFYGAFGNKQYIDLSSDNNKSVNSKKISYFFANYIEDEERANEIKKAFVANVFISYRKRDKKYVQQLIEKLHSNRKLQSVALWFDDFLTPGEDYSVEIDKQIEKSDLFVVSLTQSILEKGNYVLEHEIPNAIKFGRNILFVEMEEIDYSLNPDFDYFDRFRFVRHSEIDEVVSAISKMINLDIKNQALKIDGVGPERECYMALGYLSSIAVEKNPDIAISLLEESATNGSVRAAYKLVDLFGDKYFEKHDDEKTLKWHMFVVDNFLRLKNIRHDSKITDTAYYELGKLIEKLIELHQYDKANEYVKLIDFDEVENEEVEDALIAISSSLSKNCGHLDEALKINQKLYEEFTKRRESVKTSEEYVYRVSDLVSTVNIGEIYQTKGDFGLASKYYFEALEIASSKMNKDPNITNRLRVVNVVKGIIKFYASADFVDDRITKYVDESIELLDGLCKECRKVGYQLDMMELYNNISAYDLVKFKVTKDSVDLENANLIVLNALKMGKTIYKSEPTEQNAKLLLDVYDNLMNVLIYSQAGLEFTLKNFNDAISLCHTYTSEKPIDNAVIVQIWYLEVNLYYKMALIEAVTFKNNAAALDLLNAALEKLFDLKDYDFKEIPEFGTYLYLHTNIYQGLINVTADPRKKLGYLDQKAKYLKKMIDLKPDNKSFVMQYMEIQKILSRYNN